MKRPSVATVTSIALAASLLSGCYYERTMRAWTDKYDRTQGMLIDCNNYNSKRISDLETDVKYLRTHSVMKEDK